MIVNEAFGHRYAVQKNINIPDKILSILMKQIDLYLNTDTKKLDNKAVAEAQGHAISTVHRAHVYQDSIRTIPFFNKLQKILTPYFSEGSSLLGIHHEGVLGRVWANKMFKGSSGTLHNHINCKIVFILYIDAPEDSASLIMTDLDQYGLDYTEIPENRRHPVPAEKNMLVCHDSTVFHAVSEHKSDIPRTCIVFEFS